jgi:hypothetical protein
MFELPRREKEIIVEVEDGAVKLVLEPLTDEQYFAVNEASRHETDGGEERSVFRLSRMPGLFEDRLRRVEGGGVDGAPFEVGNPDHMQRVPQSWKSVGLARLVRTAMGLTETERGNSQAPAGSSPEGETPSPA